MNYKRIESTIKQKSLFLKHFIPEVTDMSVQGFRKAILHETIKVKDLEKISLALNVPMEYWWNEEENLFSMESSKREDVELLKRKIDRQEMTIDNLNSQILDLRKRLENKKLGWVSPGI